MTRWWMSVALAALWLAPGAVSQAQYLPCPPPQAPPTDPVPFSLTEPAQPGPLTPRNAPPGPCDALSLPASVPGAFMNCLQNEEHAFFVNVGAEALQRQALGHTNYVHLDPQVLDTGNVPLPRQIVPIGDFNDVPRDFAWGPRATVGYIWANESIEVSGFYLPENSTHAELARLGQLDLFFHNTPLGFEGDNGLWLQADRVVTTLKTTLASGEVNYRYWDKAVTGAELILGVRYVNVQEKLGIFTDDDGLTVVDVFGNPDPVRQATYETRTRNQIAAPQAGFEWQQEVNCWLSGGLSAKGAWGLNWYDVDVRLQRGDGLTAFSSHRSDRTVAQMYDLNFFVDFHILERLRIRAGYTAFWVLGVAEAVDQVDFNLANPEGRHNDHGSIFYHGPQIEMQFLF